MNKGITVIKMGIRRFFIMGLGISVFMHVPNAFAEGCTAQDRGCILRMIEGDASKIENASWRDQTYRELAKTKAFDGNMSGALALIDQIQNPDTKAMTIRGIGMAVADLKMDKDAAAAVFMRLHTKAKEITHPPSYAIALTYIAMAQAFAGDDLGAWATAAAMENDALRHKAYGESAEIQAERGDFVAADKSIGFITSSSFRNKAYDTVSHILSRKGQYDDAIAAAMKIDNAYKRASALQYVLDMQKPRDVKK